MTPNLTSDHRGNEYPRIIVADDHEWIRVILVQLIHDVLPTATIVDTEDGLQALKAYRHGRCDFLVSNHRMPHLDGMELIKQVRKHAPGLPIVMVSAHPEARSDAMAAGANWFLTKDQIPLQLPALLIEHVRNERPVEEEDGECHAPQIG